MLNQALLQILSDGKFHSRESLAKELMVTDAVLKQLIYELIELGLEVNLDYKTGYSLPRPISLLGISQILKYLPEHYQEINNSIYLFNEVDSTSAAAVRYIKNGGKGEALFLAEKQHRGRGRRGNSWISPLASNIYCSFVWPCRGGIQATDGLSLVTALSLVKSLQASSLIGVDKLQVKWPNDIWIGNKKLAGILLELHGNEKSFYHVIIGVGINVRMPSREFSRIQHFATDLVSLGNSDVDRNLIVANFLAQLHADLKLFSAEGFSAFKGSWQKIDRFHGRYVTLTSGSNIIYGKVKGVSSGGALILETAEGNKLIMGGEMAPSLHPSNSKINH